MTTPDAYPQHLFYDLENQVWYEPLGDGTIRAGFTPIAMELAGDVLVFTPKRIGRDFEKNRSFATIECGKWVGSARAAFDGIVTGYNEELVRRPELLNADAFGAAWMMLVTAGSADWRAGLITGAAVPQAFAAWAVSGAHEDRTG
mgnify:CR=1 FL=1